ncbi:MAG: formyltransferase family protein [Bacteroidales bacterium]|nr:formyltransferase family protein [Bacteroidales bacterium]
MRIGFISDSESFMPSAYALATSGLQVHLYHQPSQDKLVYRQVQGFVNQTGIPSVEEKTADDLYEWMHQMQFDICFVMGYKTRIRTSEPATGKTPIYNIHFGSLPYFKGPSPVFWQLKNGVDKLGTTIHRLTEHLDDGPVVWMKETENKSYYNYRVATQVLSRLSVEGVRFLTEQTRIGSNIPDIDRSGTPSGYQKRPILQDVIIDWQNMDASEICNLVRACNPWNKGAITFFNRCEVKLMDAVIIDNKTGSEHSLPAGSISESENTLMVQCIHNQVLHINTIFYDEMYIPGYQCRHYGFLKGLLFETPINN